MPKDCNGDMAVSFDHGFWGYRNIDAILKLACFDNPDLGRGWITTKHSMALPGKDTCSDSSSVGRLMSIPRQLAEVTDLPLLYQTQCHALSGAMSEKQTSRTITKN